MNSSGRAVAGDGVRSLFHSMPWSVLFSLFSHGLRLVFTPPLNSLSNSRLRTGAVATATAADCAPQHASGCTSAGAKLARVWSFVGLSSFCSPLLPLVGMERWFSQWVGHLFLCCHARESLSFFSSRVVTWCVTVSFCFSYVCFPPFLYCCRGWTVVFHQTVAVFVLYSLCDTGEKPHKRV